MDPHDQINVCLPCDLNNNNIYRYNIIMIINKL